ncbi:hypothetical protein YC2023_005420 [Brassica napus]
MDLKTSTSNICNQKSEKLFFATSNQLALQDCSNSSCVPPMLTETSFKNIVMPTHYLQQQPEKSKLQQSSSRLFIRLEYDFKYQLDLDPRNRAEECDSLLRETRHQIAYSEHDTCIIQPTLCVSFKLVSDTCGPLFIVGLYVVFTTTQADKQQIHGRTRSWHNLSSTIVVYLPNNPKSDQLQIHLLKVLKSITYARRWNCDYKNGRTRSWHNLSSTIVVYLPNNPKSDQLQIHLLKVLKSITYARRWNCDYKNVSLPPLITIFSISSNNEVNLFSLLSPVPRFECCNSTIKFLLLIKKLFWVESRRFRVRRIKNFQTVRFDLYDLCAHLA